MHRSGDGLTIATVLRESFMSIRCKLYNEIFLAQTDRPTDGNEGS